MLWLVGVIALVLVFRQSFENRSIPDFSSLLFLISFIFKQVKSILKYLYPVPKDDSRRVITFANQDDYISFSLVDQA